ncbi:invasion associated locus B family protein [Palleronia rufa]|uniref:invasion associated locus B family protein n=1 Tax=Palleronia rufa TaxID=1530186 RepID=UPI00068EDBCE|nr:invasion associated locus B family protein [Palleronia rufa]
MPDLLKPIFLAALLAGGGPVAAQDAETPPAAPQAQEADTPQADTPAADGAGSPEAPATGDQPQVVEPSGTDGLNMGEPADAPQAGPGSSYAAGTFGDWEQRCVRTAEGTDPCQLYQLLKDDNGNAVAEMSVFPLPQGREAAAGSTIITPLETLLTRAVTISVDGGQSRRYPFDFCAQQGCFARVGFTQAEVDQFKRGSAATMVIVPAAAPDQQIELTISLSGFTAGYDAVAKANTAGE